MTRQDKTYILGRVKCAIYINSHGHNPSSILNKYSYIIKNTCRILCWINVSWSLVPCHNSADERQHSTGKISMFFPCQFPMSKRHQILLDLQGILWNAPQSCKSPFSYRSLQVLFQCSNMTPSVLLLSEDLCREMRGGSADSSCSPSSSTLWSGQQGSMIEMDCGETVQ